MLDIWLFSTETLNILIQRINFILILMTNFNNVSYSLRKRDVQLTPRSSLVKYFFGLKPYLVCETESLYKNRFFRLNSYPTDNSLLITKFNVGQV